MVEAVMNQPLIAAPALIIKLNATCSSMEGMFLPEIRFDQNWNIAKVKDFLERKFGTNPADMRLQLLNQQNVAVAQMSDNEATLGSYNPVANMTIHIIDESGQTGLVDEFSDVSKVEKYEISEKDYAARDDTFRGWKERMVAGGHPNFTNAAGDSLYEDFMKEETEAITLD